MGLKLHWQSYLMVNIVISRNFLLANRHSTDVATVKPFPAQLHQTVRFVQRLLEGRKAENVRATMSSASTSSL